MPPTTRARPRDAAAGSSNADRRTNPQKNKEPDRAATGSTSAADRSQHATTSNERATRSSSNNKHATIGEKRAVDGNQPAAASNNRTTNSSTEPATAFDDPSSKQRKRTTASNNLTAGGSAEPAAASDDPPNTQRTPATASDGSVAVVQQLKFLLRNKEVKSGGTRPRVCRADASDCSAGPPRYRQALLSRIPASMSWLVAHPVCAAATALREGTGLVLPRARTFHEGRLPGRPHRPPRGARERRKYRSRAPDSARHG